MAQITHVCSRCGRIRTRYGKLKGTMCKTCTTVQRNIARRTHGLESHPLYQTWANILKRIDRPMASRKNRRYAGLDADPAWRDVRNFVVWALGAGWRPGLSIERKDNARGYWPDNCTFIPMPLQARHRRDNSITQRIADHVKARVAAGEVRYRVAKDIAFKYKIPLSTVVKVAYGYNWK